MKFKRQYDSYILVSSSPTIVEIVLYVVPICKCEVESLSTCSLSQVVGPKSMVLN